jgi:hypothetical protein
MRKIMGEHIKRLKERLTPEKIEELRNERIKNIKSMSSEFQLGKFAGEHIVDQLPTLSVYITRSNNVIQVSEEDRVKFHEVYENEHNWQEFQSFQKYLNKKYIPKECQCYVPALNILDEAEFKEGLIVSLWNSDICSYDLSPENINIRYDEGYYFTIIELFFKED